jgi:ABC-type antimicrobial peptide transport system permease subunit
MAELVGASVGKRRFLLALLGGFATLALVLAAAGIFGVLSYATSRRVREIGVRMAFGANRTSVVAMVLGSSGALAVAGIALGLLGAASITRLFATALYGVAPHDPLTFVVSTLVLFATALLAGAYPAWRAGTVDPVRALRAE